MKHNEQNLRLNGRNQFFLAIIGCLCLMTSCQNITEEITIELDGTGKYNTYSDIIPMITTMATEIDSIFAFPDSSGNIVRKSPAEIQETVWQDFSENMDSTLDFISTLPDSIKDDAKKMAILEKTKLYTKGGKSKGYIELGMEYNFTHIDELKAFNTLKDGEIEKISKRSPPNELNEAETMTSYIYNENSFKRIFNVIRKANLSEKDEALLQGILGQGVSKTVLYLPKEVKEVKGDYLKSVNGKTVIFEYPMAKLSKGDVDCSFEILFE